MSLHNALFFEQKISIPRGSSMSEKSKQLVSLSLALGPLGSLDAYIQRVNAIPLLTHEQELEYAKRWHEEQDVEAARQLVLPHLRFVVKVAQGFSGYGLGIADLIQEGNIGLMKAVKRFDPSVGVRLVSFAVHWIKAEIHEFILRNWRIVKVATTKAQRKLFFNLRKSQRRFDDETSAIAQDLDVSSRDVVEMNMRMNAHDLAFDGFTDEDDSHFAPSEYLEDKKANPEYLLEQDDSSSQGRDRLYFALQSLDERSQDILQQRWLSEKKATLQDLAHQYDVSPERVRQLEQNAMKRLRLALKED